jgi:predicted transporter
VGLTVALFVSQAAYTDMAVQSAAKMGALFSIFSACIGIYAQRNWQVSVPSDIKQKTAARQQRSCCLTEKKKSFRKKARHGKKNIL